MLARFGRGALAARLDYNKQKSGMDNLVQYLDDFLSVGRANSNECNQSMTLFTNICNELGVPLAYEKTIGPSPVLTFLGLEIDTNEMC
ncbi:hypothetical protein KUTeg_016545 [Tegillarca granosa]|uniref:Reverse transcriptase domain-containing protein n=1 Tax=Tegillarca granosa TaxID=220873 RepID=A0ABQ9ERF8_TEGGR|nr:hypothetical protein KUTeg_016545 [Tegillarca granosa]